MQWKSASGPKSADFQKLAFRPARPIFGIWSRIGRPIGGPILRANFSMGRLYTKVDDSLSVGKSWPAQKKMAGKIGPPNSKNWPGRAESQFSRNRPGRAANFPKRPNSQVADSGRRLALSRWGVLWRGVGNVTINWHGFSQEPRGP